MPLGILAIAALVALLIVPLSLPLLSDLLSLLRARRQERPALGGGEPSLLFLVPAHDEELLIAACAQSLLRQDYPAERRRVVVIADNCGDATAAKAREAGAEALERHDSENPGKPRALAWAMGQLPLDRYDAVVIVDADTLVDPGFARGLAAHAPLRGKAVQAYFGTLNEWENWLTRLAGVLARCRYEVTYPLKQRAGLNSPLTGNGMCLGSDLLANGGWRHFSLTENWELYADYTARGVPIEYARAALLLSQEVRSLAQGRTQRRRWLAGRLGVLRAWWRPILSSRAIGWAQKLDAIGELSAPSPVVHLVLAAILAAVALGLVGGQLGAGLAAAALATLLPLMLATLLVLARHPQPGATLRAFAMLPIYATWRIMTLVATMVSPRDATWRKTERHQHSSSRA